MARKPGVRGPIDLTGMEFTRLTAMYLLGYAKDGSGAVWRCECSCGRYCKIRRRSLLTGTTKSCGCLRRDYQRWSGEDGVSQLAKTMKDALLDIEDERSFKSAVKLARTLVDAFGAPMIARAVREIAKERK